MSGSIFNDPLFVKAHEEGLAKHEIDMLVGNAIRAKFPKPLETFAGSPRERIIEALIATCSTKEEIEKVLNEFGFGDVMVDVMETPTDEAGKEALAICKVIGGPLTKEGLPCMVLDFAIN